MKAETIIMDQDQHQLAIIDGAALWPPVGAIIELPGQRDGSELPNRDAVVREVRLRLHPPTLASVIVRVYDRDEIIPPLSEGGED